MWPNPQETADLVTFNEEIHNGKLHILCSALYYVLSQNGQTHFKNLSAFDVKSEHFGILCIKGLNNSLLDSRISCPEVLCKKAVFKDFSIFTEKRLCRSPFFNKVSGFRPATWCFPVNFAKFL